MIRAVVKKGKIQPLEALPSAWEDGQELLVVDAGPALSKEALDAWAADVDAATSTISDEEHDRFMAALEEVEAESKELARREMERSR